MCDYREFWFDEWERYARYLSDYAKGEVARHCP